MRATVCPIRGTISGRRGPCRRARRRQPRSGACRALGCRLEGRPRRSRRGRHGWRRAAAAGGRCPPETPAGSASPRKVPRTCVGYQAGWPMTADVRGAGSAARRTRHGPRRRRFRCAGLCEWWPWRSRNAQGRWWRDRGAGSVPKPKDIPPAGLHIRRATPCGPGPEHHPSRRHMQGQCQSYSLARVAEGLASARLIKAASTKLISATSTGASNRTSRKPRSPPPTGHPAHPPARAGLA